MLEIHISSSAAHLSITDSDREEKEKGRVSYVFFSEALTVKMSKSLVALWQYIPCFQINK